MESTRGVMNGGGARPEDGRRALAERNDRRIREAARAVFTADPEAPVSAVARHAGVGISALYRRYRSKEDLLQRLADEGMDRYLAEVERALADDRDPWTAFADFMRRCLDMGAGTLALRLAGGVPATEEMTAKESRMREATERLLDRLKEAGAVRRDIGAGDVAVVLEHVHAIRVGEDERLRRLRHRYLTFVLAGLRMPEDVELPGPAPTWQEVRAR
ncbi:TetR family transcriptional regulator [Actinomadura rubrobrunea]|uniref:TetR family transcriptional regulator n=1 Tax=Actinomadura rubrobrunea TaxID=115335 RepID=A0A9W6PYL9_9ACTN|nr:TetR/AcrR family transcriptional regulator [Actinomadura rubrobrunea]GLW65368.1 TetR family transcriptional regulator [Actinomadura rubrobrunea]